MWKIQFFKVFKCTPSTPSTSVAAGLSNRPVARSHIAVGAMGLPPLHIVCGGAGQLWIPRTYMWCEQFCVLCLRYLLLHISCFSTLYSYIFAAIFVYIFVHPRLHSSVDAQLHFRGHFRVHFRTSTPTFICGRTVTSLFYTYIHLWMYSGLYNVTATTSRPISCTFLYIYAYIHLWTHSDVSVLHLHSSVDVQRFLQCYSYIFAAIFVYIFVHPRLHPRGPSLALFSRWQRVHGYTSLIRPRLHSSLHSLHSTFYTLAAHHLPCFQGGKECMATLHSSDRDFTLLYSTFYIYIKRTFSWFNYTLS